jgi:hypothetical protein
MKKLLLTALLTLGLSTAAIAENPAEAGAYTAPDSSTMDFSGDYDFAIGVAEDYGFGLTMQFKKMIDVSVGHAGVGADFIFFRYNFMEKSKFFSTKPLNFYVGGGAGYVWDEKYANLRKGLMFRTPIGADWQFANHWGVYLSAAPAINLEADTVENNNDGGAKFIVMGTIGIRYLF